MQPRRSSVCRRRHSIWTPHILGDIRRQDHTRAVAAGIHRQYGRLHQRDRNEGLRYTGHRGILLRSDHKDFVGRLQGQRAPLHIHHRRQAQLRRRIPRERQRCGIPLRNSQRRGDGLDIHIVGGYGLRPARYGHLLPLPPERPYDRMETHQAQL